MKLVGNFLKIETANQALSKLKGSGFTDAYIEIDDNNNNIKRNLANKRGLGLSKLIIDPNDVHAHPLTSVSPLINVTAGFSEFNDSNYKLIVEADIGIIARAEELIKSLGGKIENVPIDFGRVHEGIGDLNVKFKNEEI
jgi:hypothetical protein